MLDSFAPLCSTTTPVTTRKSCPDSIEWRMPRRTSRPAQSGVPPGTAGAPGFVGSTPSLQKLLSTTGRSGSPSRKATNTSSPASGRKNHPRSGPPPMATIGAHDEVSAPGSDGKLTLILLDLSGSLFETTMPVITERWSWLLGALSTPRSGSPPCHRSCCSAAATLPARPRRSPAAQTLSGPNPSSCFLGAPDPRCAVLDPLQRAFVGISPPRPFDSPAGR